ncbi:MAG: SRPBCC family protein [Actinomycetota bacterium]
MVVNVHERRYPDADPGELGALIDTVGSPHDRLWPANGRWPAMRLDGPLDEHPAGGHGMVRYHVEEHVPGERVVFRFEPETGIDGVHVIELLPGPTLRHSIRGRTHGSMRLAWPLAVRWLHERCIVDLFDQAAISLGRPIEPTRPSAWVRFLLRVGPSPEREDAWASRQG